MGRMADSTFTAVDLSRLPWPGFIVVPDFETILARLVVRAKAVMPDFEVRESDPSTKLLQLFAYEIQAVYQKVNDGARAVMPAYAVGGDLDNIAALFFGIERFEITPADTVLGIPAVMESDTDFRRRMVLGPEGYSVAGPEGAYTSLAVNADADVLDASATSPAPGEVVISVLSRTGAGTASAELLAIVNAYVSDETRRPLTDYVTVQSAEILFYAVDATLTTFSGPDGGVVLAAAQASLDAYIEASHRLGRDVTRSGLFAALHVEGVQNVVLASPAADLIVSRTQAPHCTGTTIAYAGIGE